MRIVIRSGEPTLVADSEDMHLPPNTLCVDEVYALGMGKMVVFRCLTDDGQLFGAAIEDKRPLHEKWMLGQVVVQRAATAEPHTGRFVLREVDAAEGLMESA